MDTAVSSLSTSDHQSCLPEGVEKLSSEGCGCWGSQHVPERRFHQDLQRRVERGVKCEPYSPPGNNFSFQLGDCVVEGADWSIENFGSGVYVCAARDGKILWEEVSV